MSPEDNGDKVVSTTVPAVQALVIAGTGNGGMVEKTIVTPPGQPNIIIQVVSPMLAILVRFVNSFLVMLVSLVSAGMTTNIIPAKDFMDLVVKCATLSVAGAGLGFLKDLVTVFGALEKRWPLLRA